MKWQTVLAATVMFSAAEAGAAEVAWHAPAECADPRQTLEEAERLLGRPLADVRAVDFDVSITNDRERQGNPLDCGFAQTCLSACSCDASGCTSWRKDPQAELQVDAALDADGKTLVGTLLLPDPRTIRLARP